jgi:hypothetical protein
MSKTKRLILGFMGLVLTSSLYANRIFSIDNIDRTMPIALDYFYAMPPGGDYHYAASLGMGDFKTISIGGDELPPYWKITGSANHRIECENEGVIKIEDNALQYNDLLLEVNFYNKKDGTFLALIIDTDGGGPYSKMIHCRVIKP